MTDQITAPAEVVSVPAPAPTTDSSDPASSIKPTSKGAKGLELPELDPWHEPVDGAELLDQFATTFERFLSLPDGAAEVLALWTVFTHTFDAWESSPRLALTSPVPGCGKTTVLSLLGQLVRRPLPTSNVTPAVVFRAIEQWQPTLLIDEMDSFLGDNDQLRGILNSGHARHMAYVWRTDGDNYQPRPFSTWAPMAVAKIGKLPATLADRAIEIRMRRALPDEQIERFRRRHEAELAVIIRKAARWAQDHVEELAAAEPDMPAGLRNRAADNWRPLLAIADAAGGAWPQQAGASVRTLWGEADGEVSTGEELLGDIRDIFERYDRLSSFQLVTKLGDLKDKPWGHWDKGKCITERQLAAQLKPFGIKPATIRFNDKTLRGYKREDFEDVCARYLPPGNRNTETIH
jgi:hypothetical protein